jgi:hypothetical protein
MIRGVSVLWTGHLSAISISRARVASGTSPSIAMPRGNLADIAFLGFAKILQDGGTVWPSGSNYKHCRGFKEMNLLPAHRSSNPIWSATQAGLGSIVSPWGRTINISVG